MTVNLQEYTTSELNAMLLNVKNELESRERIEALKLQEDFMKAFNACIEYGISIVASSSYVDTADRNGAYSIKLS